MAKEDQIELTGTREERWKQAVRLAYTDVTDKELKNFYAIYKEAGVPLLPAAEELFKKYGGVFRTLGGYLDYIFFKIFLEKDF